jgi:hypothetical protein
MRHVDHVELTWRLLEELPREEAFARLVARLQSLAAAAGRPEKYDGAMTRAYFDLVDARRRPHENFADFCARNQDLLLHGAELVARVLALQPCSS